MYAAGLLLGILLAVPLLWAIGAFNPLGRLGTPPWRLRQAQKEVTPVDDNMGPRDRYIAGGGTFPNERVAALMAEAQRGWERRNDPPPRTLTPEEREAESQAMRAARDEFLTHTRPAGAAEYTAWLTGYLAAGGWTTMDYDYDLPARHFVALVDDGQTLPTLYGARSQAVIVPAGLTLHVNGDFHGSCGHSTVYFMDGFRVHGSWVPTYRDVRAQIAGD